MSAKKTSQTSLAFLSDIPKFFYISSGIIFLLVIFFHAWVTDDAFFTFRVIDNFVNGHGLRWNTSERVQVYTHPLWMLVHIPFYFFTDEVLYTTTFISLLCCIGIYITLAQPVKKCPVTIIFFILLPLIASKTIRDFSSSGLENPLSLLLLSSFAFFFFKEKTKQVPWLLLTLIATLGVLNRMDHVLLYGPAMVLLLLRHVNDVPIRRCIVASSPLLLWLIFSLFYYGSIFPNTKYAKLNAGVPLNEYFVQGYAYLIDFIRNDTTAAFVICVAIILSIFHSVSFKRTSNNQQTKIAAFGLGIIFYILYVIYIGGDFMSGRMFSSPIIVAIIVLIQSLLWIDDRKKQRLFLFLFAGVIMLGLGIGSVISSPKEPIIRASGIADERAYYERTNSVIGNLTGEAKLHQHNWAKLGRRIKRNVRRNRYPGNVVLYLNPATVGYFAGPNTILIERFALSESLLARIPMERRPKWRIGHLRRPIPNGYLAARRSLNFSAMDPALRDYYFKLRYITTGPLFDSERLKTILQFNFGAYDHLLEDYIQRNRKKFYRNADAILD